MSPFTMIPPTIRKWLYIAYGIATLAVSSFATYCAALTQPAPDWVIGTGAVLVPIGVAIGATAAANTPPAETQPSQQLVAVPPPQDGLF